MSGVTTRDTLAKVLETALCERGWLDSGDAGDAAPEIADALLASGAVIDTAALADNMPLVAIIQTETGALFAPASRAMHRIAAVLSERTS